MTAQSPLTESQIPPPVVSDEFGNNPPTEAKKNIPWTRVVRGDTEETMPLAPPPDEPRKEEAISLPGDHIDAKEEAISLPGDHIDPKEEAISLPDDHIDAKEEQATSLPGDHIDADIGNADSPKKSAWNKPIGGVIGVSTPVIGGITSWPALSESTRSVAKLTSDSSKNPAVDKQSVAHSKAPLVSHLSPKQATSNRNSSTGPNNTAADRHRWTKRSGNQAVRNVRNAFGRPIPPPSLPPPPPPPPFPCFELPYVPPIFPMVDNSHFPADQSSRKVNFVSHPTGDSTHLDFNERRRGQDRNWSAAQNSNVRDLNFGRPFVPFRGFMRSPSPPPPPPPPPPMRPFLNPIRFAAANPFLCYSALPFYGNALPPLQEVPFPFGDLSLSLVRQIDYYFSDANLVRDDYLRSNMDDHGWVPVTLIAGFPRVQQITSDFDLILNSMRASSVVEIQDGKVRRRNGWNKWISGSSQVTSNCSRIEGNADSSN